MIKGQQTRKTETAQQAYDRNLKALRSRMEQIELKIKDHAPTFDGRNWGYVGDLAHYNELLGRILGEEE